MIVMAHLITTIVVELQFFKNSLMFALLFPWLTADYAEILVPADKSAHSPWFVVVLCIYLEQSMTVSIKEGYFHLMIN